MTKRTNDLWFYGLLFLATAAIWVGVRYMVIRPQVYEVIGDFKTEVIIPNLSDEAKKEIEATGKVTPKSRTVKEPTKKSDVSKQTKRNTNKANALKQCSNVTISCMAAMERMLKDSVAARGSSK